MKNYFQELYEQHHAPIYRYIFYLLQHQMIAEDLTQETFTKCYEKNMHFINHTEALYWLRKVARNLAYDYYRRQRLIHWLPLVQEVTDGTDTLTYLEQQEEVKMLYQTLTQLKISYREVIILRKIENLSIKETAALLQWSESKVKNTLSRALHMLALKMEGLNHE